MARVDEMSAPNSANLLHGRSPLSEINSNDLILAQSMPSGAVHTNKLAAVPLLIATHRANIRAKDLRTLSVPTTRQLQLLDCLADERI
jgi:hypothetical protein